jgi:hypothetical protein
MHLEPDGYRRDHLGHLEHHDPRCCPSLTHVFVPDPQRYVRTTGTRKEALEAGFSNKEIDNYGPDGKLPVTSCSPMGDTESSSSGTTGEGVGCTATYTATEKLWVAGDEAKDARAASTRIGGRSTASALVETRAKADARQTWT